MHTRMRERVIKALIAARESVRHGWTQDSEVRWVYGRRTVCAVGALGDGVNAVAGTQTALDQDRAVLMAEAQSIFCEAIDQLWVDRSWSSIPCWNDEPGRKKTEVLDTFDRALKIAGHDS
jgi:hypothetical protein